MSRLCWLRPLLAGLCLTVPGWAQRIQIRSAPRVEMPAAADSNSPAFWRDGQLHIFNSWGFPSLSAGPDQYNQSRLDGLELNAEDHLPMWMESAWADPDGTIYGWYHHEPAGICPGTTLTSPRIGAAVSFDGGKRFYDLGIVLESGDADDCSAKNQFFAGGHGDFSVVLGRQRRFFYFLFTNYGGPVSSQGVAIARMAVADRANPAGKVWKYHDGEWKQPGLGGAVTPILPARVAWQSANADSFWGPAVHWNTYLNSFVMLLNRSCCSPGWPQEGIYASFNADLAKAGAWTPPQRIMKPNGGYLSWYPQVIGNKPEGTDTRAGQNARLYLHGRSDWKIVFAK